MSYEGIGHVILITTLKSHAYSLNYSSCTAHYGFKFWFAWRAVSGFGHRWKILLFNKSYEV